MKKNRQQASGFYNKIFRLLLPIVAQNLLSAAVSSADVVMLNDVGQASVAAVSMAAQYTHILYMVFYGLGTGSAALCTQYFGKGDQKAIQVIEGTALRFSLMASVVFGGAALLIPETLMKIFTQEEELITIGASYMRVVSIAYFCWGISEVYLSVLRSIGRVLVSTLINAAALVLNVVLNAVFIFGLLGLPRMGAAGAAAATSAARLTELVLCLAVSFFSRDVKLDFRYLFVRNKLLFYDFMKVSLPALGNDISYSVAFSMYSVVMGHLGTEAVAAYSFACVVRNFGTILCYGMASAGGILLGKIMGEGRMEEAREAAGKIIRLTVITAAIGGMILLTSPFVLSFADLNDRALGYLRAMLFINSYYVMGGAITVTLIAGIFRTGGDSRFGFICDTVVMWGYGVTAGFAAAFLLKLPVEWVYFLLCLDEFVKWPWVIKHYRSGRWLKNITRDHLFSEGS